MSQILKYLSVIMLVSSVPSFAISANNQCDSEGFWAGFVLYSRANGTTKKEIIELADLTFPKSQFPFMNSQSKDIADEIYSWWKMKVRRYKPYGKDEIIKVENEFSKACMKR
mgnify:CR=1 FL=1